MQYTKPDDAKPKPIFRNNLELYHWKDAIEMIPILSAKKYHCLVSTVFI